MAQRIRPWSDEEDQWLLDLVAEGKSNADIALEIGRSTGSIANRVLLLRNGGDVVGTYRARDARCTWTPDQDSLLLLHYGSDTLSQVCARLGKSPQAVKNRISRLRQGQTRGNVLALPGTQPDALAGDRARQQRADILQLLDRGTYPVSPLWEPIDDFRIRLFYGDLPLPELAARLGRTVNAVRARVVHLNWSLDKAIAFRLEVSRSPLWLVALQALQALSWSTRRTEKTLEGVRP